MKNMIRILACEATFDSWSTTTAISENIGSLVAIKLCKEKNNMNSYIHTFCGKVKVNVHTFRQILYRILTTRIELLEAESSVSFSV